MNYDMNERLLQEHSNIPQAGCYQRFFNSYSLSLVKDRVVINNIPDIELPNNAVRTNKYNCFTFLPLNLFDQVMRISNIYFILIGVLQIIPSISNSNGVPTIYFPLVVIMVVTAIKDLYEDNKRKNSDNEENQMKAFVLQDGEFAIVQSQQLRVGNIIKVHKDEFLPADVLVLETNHKKGEAFIETKNLDGETNLKQKQCPFELLQILQQTGFDYNFEVEYEKPNEYLYKFNGKVVTPEKTIILDVNSIILRGSKLRNTEYLIGLVLYTGHNTRIMMNQFKGKSKKSTLDKKMSHQVIVIFFLQIIVCLIAASINGMSENDDKFDNQLGSSDEQNASTFFINFFSWLLNLSNFVPISLLVTLDMVKVLQGYFLTNDPAMISKQTQIPTEVNQSSLNEELGSIVHIFSDKTGTLTQNIMEFRKISINGFSYGELKKGQANYLENIDHLPEVPNVNFRDGTLFANSKTKEVYDTLVHLAVCHQCVIEKEESGHVSYNASSPDDLALVYFAKYVGVSFEGMDEMNNIVVKAFGNDIKFNLKYILEFSSARKRMSVIFTDAQGNYKIFTKGADSIMYDRLDMNKSQFPQETQMNLNNYGKIGLRTLVLAYRDINKNEFLEWEQQYRLALTSDQNRDEKVEKIQEIIEKNLILLAATAIEDKLQDEVQETIESLQQAGIKVWVLTGDKIETAINIGLSCGLLSQSMQLIIIDEKNESQLQYILQQKLKLIKANTVYGLVVQGDSLAICFKKECVGTFMNICNKCKAVLCCRVSPKQKQEVVTLVRSYDKSVCTLAIGDGANDVNMITAAHVGIGIKGREGTQAARSSDYSIGEFKILKRLLLVFGRISYRNNSILIIYNFYKNVLLVMPQFWYGIFNFFSSSSIYDNYVYQLYNVFYAALPIIIFSLFDTDVHKKKLFANQLNYYIDGINHKFFNPIIFWVTLLFAFIHSVILTFAAYLSLSSNFTGAQGYSMNYYTSGAMIFGMAVVIVNLKVLIYQYRISFMVLFFNLGSMIVYFVSLVVISNVPNSDLYQQFIPLMKTPNFHLGNLLILCLITLPDLIIEWVQRWITYAKRQENYFQTLSKSIDYYNQHTEIVPMIEEQNEIELQEISYQQYEQTALSLSEKRNIIKQQKQQLSQTQPLVQQQQQFQQQQQQYQQQIKPSIQINQGFQGQQQVNNQQDSHLIRHIQNQQELIQSVNRSKQQTRPLNSRVNDSDFNNSQYRGEESIQSAPWNNQQKFESNNSKVSSQQGREYFQQSNYVRKNLKSSAYSKY